MTVVDSRMSVWEALAGRAPGKPVGPADPGLWAAVAERLNPARARPVLRPGIESAELVSVRGTPYLMLRSPDDRGRACYLRLTPQEWQLARLMDGTRTVARLVAEFARISGRLAPDQVTRVVADLAGNRMLAELPVDALRPLDRVHRRPWPARLGRALLATVRGRRMVLANIDPLVDLLYRGGGRLLFTRGAAVLLALVAVTGLALFGWTWWRGDQSVFLTGGSYAAGAAVLLGLNVVALACHELGHALATRHAGRRVPAAGLLVYFGIPSVFVDTTDVWLAGRRARLLTTASGPAAGLVLAGIAGIVGFLVPAAAPWTFKLAFAWYLNALFNLNPFLALDGYYLLMDWLEIPNLRARGLAYVVGRLRRRPPRWADLDREGRLVALYGMLAVLWLVIAVNLGWRIWTDRVAGLVTGLWRAGWPARILLAAVIAGLAAPVVYAAFALAGRRLHRLRRRWAERRYDADRPRRLDALRRSALGRLPAAILADLATQARWVRPRAGRQLVLAGAAQPAVYVVVDGALEGRHPGDPAGTIRERIGAGGVAGLASALTGAPATLSWHTAGTTLLAIPPSVVASSVGPVVGPLPVDRADAETLFAEAPALRALSAEDRLGLVARARPAGLAPGTPIHLPGPGDALLVESGVVAVPGGGELRRGALIGPVGEAHPEPVAAARTTVRLWALPAAAGLPVLLGAAPDAATTGPPGSAPAAGVHPTADYPPLAVPPGPPPDADDRIDRGFERRLWWLVLLLLLLALLATGTNLVPGPAWAEMPTDRARLTADRGRLDVTFGGRRLTLEPGSALYVAAGDDIRVRDRSTGRLEFRGGAVAVLCAGSRVAVGPMWSAGARPVTPSAELALDRGRLLADTVRTSGAFIPLSLRVAGAAGVTVNHGPARYSVDGGGARVATGEVRVDGVPRRAEGGRPDCGTGDPVPPPAGPTPPAVEPPASADPSPVATPTPPTATPTPTRTPSRLPPSTRPPTTPPPVTPPPATPPANRAPVVGWVANPGGDLTLTYKQDPAICSRVLPAQRVYGVTVRDDRDTTAGLTVELRYSGAVSGTRTMLPRGDTFHATIGPFAYEDHGDLTGRITVTVVATDSDGAATTIRGNPMDLVGCPGIRIG
ncbi:cyclic nucleotide-binding protein [Polymorphospora rubra]|uniref:cyclic nucleotide-binding protein n=1 Tax=Polymorphospora rubra TaxID=338584 RepID=UPI0033CDE534